MVGRQSLNGSAAGRPRGDPKLQAFLEENNLLDMLHLLHVEFAPADPRSREFDPEIFLNTFHPDADTDSLAAAKETLNPKVLSNSKIQRLLLISSSPLVLENFFKVRGVNEALSTSSVEKQLTAIEGEKTSRPPSAEILDILAKTNADLTVKESAMSAMVVVKSCMSKLREYEKTCEELQAMYNSGNFQGVLEVVRESNLAEVVNNKNLIIFNQLHRKFEKLLGSVQDSILRSFDVRSDLARLDTSISLVTQLAGKNIIVPAVDRLWGVANAQATSIILKGEIVQRELSISKEEDLIFKLKSDVYEKFINKHLNLQKDDLSKNFGAYLDSVTQTFNGLNTCARLFSSEAAKSELTRAMKLHLGELKSRLDEIVHLLDYRLVEHPALSSGLGNLIQTLRRLYFDQNPVEVNKQIKFAVFKILVGYYRFQFRAALKQSMVRLTQRKTEAGKTSSRTSSAGSETRSWSSRCSMSARTSRTSTCSTRTSWRSSWRSSSSPSSEQSTRQSCSRKTSMRVCTRST